MPKRIAFCDLNHTAVGIHTETMPLSIGLLGSYLKKHFGSDVDVRLYKFPEDLTRDLGQGWTPDVVGAALYTWNTRLNLHYARCVKQKNPEAIVVTGGPDIPTEPDEIKQFLVRNDHIDLLVNLDGEIPVRLAMEAILKGEDGPGLRRNPVFGTRSLPRNSDAVIYAPMPERLKSLDDIPSPYLNGMFDPFFKLGTLAPFIETNRGCPFTCTFCHSALSYFTKLLWKSIETLEQELELFARSFAGRHDIRLFLTDSNFGTFTRDQEIAKIIRKYQDQYDWPRFIEVTTGKTLPDNIVKTVKILKYGLATTASVQTMSPDVLKNIQRRNLEFKDFLRLQQMSKEAGGSSVTEMILSLPGETKESFLEAIRTVIRAEIDEIVVYTLMNLRGTPLYDEMNFARKNRGNILFKYRVVPQQFGRYEGRTLLDIEEVVVGTPTMPFEDYVWLRGFTLVLQNVYNAKAFPEMAYFLRENKVDIMDWLLKIYDQVLSSESAANRQMKAFLQETRDECFDSEEALQAFFEQDANYNKLISGELGRNLRSKYVCLALQDGFEDWLDISISVAKECLATADNDLAEREMDGLLQDLKTYFSATRNVVYYFFHENIDSYLEQRHAIELEYDIPTWITGRREGHEDKLLLNSLWHGKKAYELDFSDKLKENIKTVNHKEKTKKLVNIQYILNAFSSHYWPELKQLEVA